MNVYCGYMDPREAVLLLPNETEWALGNKAHVLLRPMDPDGESRCKELHQEYRNGKRLKPEQVGVSMDVPWHELWKPKWLLEPWCNTRDLHKLRPALFPGFKSYPPYLYKVGYNWGNIPEEVWQEPSRMPPEAWRKKVWFMAWDICRVMDLKPYEVYDLLPVELTLLQGEKERIYRDAVGGVPDKPRKLKQSEVLNLYFKIYLENEMGQDLAKVYWNTWKDRLQMDPQMWIHVVRYSEYTQRDEERMEEYRQRHMEED